MASETPAGIYHLNRRAFFIKSFLASVALSSPGLFISCNKKPDFEGSGIGPYKVWEEMLHYLKSSPDHLEGRMNTLIAQKDPKAMFDFVRDEFYLIPISDKKIGYGYESKWGLRYVLRSGYATVREKAELLNNMFQKAGIPSRIRSERTSINPEESARFFFRLIERVTAPDIPGSVLRRWESVMGKAIESPEIINFSDDLEEATTLGRQIWDLLDLPENHYYNTFDFRWDNYNSPIVEFEYDGKVQYACVYDPEIPFGELHSGNPNNLRDANQTKESEDKVSLKVTYREAISPKKVKELISGEWMAKELVGRQLDLLFLNNLSLEEQAATPINGISVFTPALGLQAMDESAEYMASRTVLADPITLKGERIRMNERSISIGDNEIKLSSDPNLRSKVTKIEASIQEKVLPELQLNIKAFDSNGNLITGLQARDFTFSENGKPIKAFMKTNTLAPKVLLMADISMSMPESYSGVKLQDFIENLWSKITDNYPEAHITYWETPSSLYTWMLKASQSNYDLIIYATDGDNDDEYEPKNEMVYRNGPPALILNVKGSDFRYHRETFDHLANLTNGLHLNATDQETTLEKIRSFFDSIEIYPYQFTLAALHQKGALKLGFDHRLFDELTYQFDSLSTTVMGPSIIGVYLEIQYAKHPPIKRVLAGWDPIAYPNESPSEKMRNEVKDLFLGRTQLLFEGEGPTFSALLSDVLKAKLSTRPWGEALLKEDLAKAKEAYMQGFSSIDTTGLSLMLPLSKPATTSSFTFCGGLRIAIQSLRPGFMTEKGSSRFDFLPTSKFTTLHLDAKTAFQQTLQQTAQLAIREDRFFKESTYSALKNKSLVNINQLNTYDWIKEYEKESDGSYWYEHVFRGRKLRLIDQKAGTKAFWHIDKDTGEVYGILADASGGGASDFDDHVDKTETLAEALGALIGIVENIKGGGLNGIGAFSLGVIAQYGVTLVKLYAIASEAIMIMDTSGMDEKIREAMAELACNVAKEIFFATTGNAGSIMGGLDSLIELMVGDDSPFSC